MRVLLLLFCWAVAVSAQGPAQEIRVVAYNIHHGVGMDGKLDLQRIAAVIAKQKPDVVALQEVDRLVGRSGKVDQAAELAKMLGMHHVFGKCIDLDGGGYGNAVLSKYPIKKSTVHSLPGNVEPRAVLEVEVEKAGKTVSFCSVHLDWTKEEVRLLQVKEIERVFAKHQHPVLLLGDFNARPKSLTMKFLAMTWTVVAKTGPVLTSPADQPRSEIDYVLVRGMDATKAKSSVVNEPVASDHRPVTAVIPWN